MKTLYRILAVGAIALGIVLAGAVSVQAQQSALHSPYFTADKIHQFETNLIVALNSGIPGMQSSAAQTLRELRLYNPDYDYSRSIIPLMRIVKSEGADTPARLCAVLALFDLRSDRGDYAITMTAKFSDNARVKTLCTWLSYVRQLGDANVSSAGHEVKGDIVQK